VHVGRACSGDIGADEERHDLELEIRHPLLEGARDQ